MSIRRKVLAFGVPVVLLAGYVTWASVRPLPAIPATSDIPVTTTLEAPNPQIAWSNYGEQAVGVPGYGVLATHGDQTPLPTASVAKVMAALAILHEKPLAVGEQGPNVPITDADVALYQQAQAQDQSVVPVQAGEQLSEYQALQAMLIPSANNVATTTVTWAFGSLQKYLDFANSYAKQLGMQHATFVDASGFDPSTVASPSDLVLLGEVAMQNPVVAEIVGQRSATLPGAGKVNNYNAVLGNSVGINGIKTGNNDQDLGCLLYSTPFEGTNLVGVIMDAPDLGTALNEGSNVAASFKNAVQKDQVVAANQVVAHYALPWGGRVDALAQKDLSVIDWKGTKVPVAVSLKAVKLSGKKGDTLGNANFNYNNTRHQTSVSLAADIPGPSIWWRVTHP